MDLLPQFDPAANPTIFQPMRPRGADDATYAARKEQAARRSQMTTGMQGLPPRQAGLEEQTPVGSAFAAQSENGSTPADMALAVSASAEVQLVNSAIAVYDTHGTLKKGFPKALSTFFPGTTGDLGDIRAFYDKQSSRFVVMADDFSGGLVYLAASQTSNPTGKWNIYSVGPWGAANCRSSGSACNDFPQLGFDNDTIFIGVNLFSGSGAVSDWMLLLPKAQIYAGQGFSYNYWSGLTWNGTGIDSLQPVSLVSGNEKPRAGFAIGSFNINFGGGQCSSGCNGLMVWAFSNNLVASGSPGPEFSAVGVGTANNYSLPPGANEPGCPNCIDTGDTRISGSPIYHAGLISASLNTNGTGGSHVLWFQARPTLNDNDARCTGAFANTCPQVTALSLVNEDCFICGGEGSGGSTYYGTLVTDDDGDLTMVHNFSDNNTYPESAYTSRRVTYQANAMHDSGFVMCGGGAKYTQGRWGDYTATSNSIEGKQVTMWFAAMNALSNGNWGTCVGRNSFTAVNQP